MKTVNLNEFFEELAKESGRNMKIEMLMANKENRELREIIRLALDPFTQFYIRKIPAYTPATNPTMDLGQAMGALYDLSARLVTGNDAIAHLTNILESSDPYVAKIIERIIQKDLKCGVQASTANKVWMGLVPTYPCMLCSGYEQRLVDKIEFPAYVQLKMDGMRFNAIVKDGAVTFRSRNGKELDLLGNLEQEFLEMAGMMDCVFDGELLIRDTDKKIVDRQTGNGILSKANKGTISKEEASRIHATVWDVISLVTFQDGYDPQPYEKRFERLASMNMPERIELVTTSIAPDLETANELFESYLQAGQEGIILKDKNGVWENKRAKHQIKFKGELECDLLITETVKGTGKYDGMLGAVVCQSADGKIKVNVGSGFNEEQRKTFTEKDLVGKVVAVKYNARIKNKLGDESLFLPIFIEVREDKDVADSSEVIKLAKFIECLSGDMVLSSISLKLLMNNMSSGIVSNSDTMIMKILTMKQRTFGKV